MVARNPEEHGSVTGYRQHVGNGDKGADICLPCRNAQREYQRLRNAETQAARPAKYVFQREDWVIDAACRGLDPSMFIVERGEINAARKAKAVCATCSVSEPCLEYALRKHLSPDGMLAFLDGIYAGTNYLDRRQIRAERQRALTESMSRHPSRGQGAA